jgi:glutaredoxin
MMTVYVTRRCPHCNQTGAIGVDDKELMTYLRGEYVQRAFPNLSTPLREQIISGVHPKCWEEMFGQQEDEFAND